MHSFQKGRHTEAIFLEMSRKSQVVCYTTCTLSTVYLYIFVPNFNTENIMEAQYFHFSQHQHFLLQERIYKDVIPKVFQINGGKAMLTGAVLFLPKLKHYIAVRIKSGSDW